MRARKDLWKESHNTAAGKTRELSRRSLSKKRENWIDSFSGRRVFGAVDKVYDGTKSLEMEGLGGEKIASYRQVQRHWFRYVGGGRL